MLNPLRLLLCEMAIEVTIVAGLFFATVACVFLGSLCASRSIYPHYSLEQLIRVEMQALEEEENAQRRTRHAVAGGH